jgi:hypothetical protein
VHSVGPLYIKNRVNMFVGVNCIINYDIDMSCLVKIVPTRDTLA